jgi:hypothetical protein
MSERQITSFDARAAVLAVATGLTLGATACKGKPEGSAATTTVTAAASASTGGSGAKACCKGLNDCKGKGGCAVDGKHDCAGQNDCKGKGGCNMHCPK